MHRSLWLEEALAADAGGPAPALTGDQKADICIVGGGYTGLWTALRIKESEPGCDVARLREHAGHADDGDVAEPSHYNSNPRTAGAATSRDCSSRAWSDTVVCSKRSATLSAPG